MSLIPRILRRHPVVPPSPEDLLYLAVVLADETIFSRAPLAARATETITPEESAFRRETVLTYELAGLLRDFRSVLHPGLARLLDGTPPPEDAIQLILPLRVIKKDERVGVLRVSSPAGPASIVGPDLSRDLHRTLMRLIVRRLHDRAEATKTATSPVAQPYRKLHSRTGAILALSAEEHADAISALLKDLKSERSAPALTVPQNDAALQKDLLALGDVHGSHVIWVRIELPVATALAGFELHTSLVTQPPRLATTRTPATSSDGDPNDATGQSRAKDKPGHKTRTDGEGLEIPLDWPRQVSSYHLVCRPRADYFIRESTVRWRCPAPHDQPAGNRTQGDPAAPETPIVPPTTAGPTAELTFYWTREGSASPIPTSVTIRTAERPPGTAELLSDLSLGLAGVNLLLSFLALDYAPSSPRVSVDIASAIVVMAAVFTGWWTLRPIGDTSGWSRISPQERRQPLLLVLVNMSVWASAVVHILAAAPEVDTHPQRVNGPGPDWLGRLLSPLWPVSDHGTAGVLAVTSVISCGILLITGCRLRRLSRAIKDDWAAATETADIKQPEHRPPKCLQRHASHAPTLSTTPGPPGLGHGNADESRQRAGKRSTTTQHPRYTKELP